MKRISAKRAKIGAVGALGASLLCTLTLGLTGMFGAPAASAMTTANNIRNVEELYDGNGVFNQTNLSTLVEKIAGTTGATVADLNTSAGSGITSATINARNGGKDIIVGFGGMNWTVTYVSKSDSGDVIATLWLAEGARSDAQPWSAGWYANNGVVDYPSNMYSTSYIRSHLNGTPYAQAAGATPGTTALDLGTDTVTINAKVSINYAGAQASKWAPFTSGILTDYLVQPRYVSWQRDGLGELTDLGWGWGYDAANDQLQIDSTGADKKDTGLKFLTSSSEPYSLDYFGKGKNSLNTGYNSWGNDYLWLPAASEVGHPRANDNYTSQIGLWHTTLEQRKNNTGVIDDYTERVNHTGTYSYTFLRSARGGHAFSCYALDANGGNTSDYNPYMLSRSGAVRPALHLNLTKAEQTATNNQDLIDLWNQTVESSLLHGGRQETFTLTRDWNATADGTYTTTFGTGDFISQGRLYIPAGASIKLDLNGYSLNRCLDAAVEDGSVIAVNNGTLEVYDGSAAQTGRITGGNTTGSGGGINFAGGKFVMTGGSIYGNKAVNGGGVNMNGTRADLIKGRFANNESTASNGKGFGGGIYFTGGRTMTVEEGMVFENNSTQRSGGAIYGVTGGELVINGGEFKNNKAKEYGGGICMHNVNLTIHDVDVHDNVATYGGGVEVTGSTVFTMYGGKVRGNVATLSGGGVYIAYHSSGGGAKFNLYGGEISGNFVTIYGGGVYVAPQAEMTMYGGKITGNEGTDLDNGTGGGIFVSGTLKIESGEISYNKTSRGGGIFTQGNETNAATAIFNGGTINNNTVTIYGGGLYINYYSEFVMNGGYITENVSDGNPPTSAHGNKGSGGGVFMNDHSTLSMNGGMIRMNTAVDLGGGVVLYKTPATFNFTGGIVSGNSVNGAGNNVYMSSISHKITVKGNLSGKAAKLGISSPATTAVQITSDYYNAGNTVTSAEARKYFYSDAGRVIEAANNEVTMTANPGSATTWYDWKTVHNGTQTGTAGYATVPYDGEPYSVVCLSGSTNITVTGKDENGRPVTSFTKAGTYTFSAATVTGYSNPYFTVVVEPVNFNDNIDKLNISVPSVTYTGSALTPEPVVTYDGKTLIKGTDYTVSYSNNVNSGYGLVEVTGKGNYDGKAASSFVIEKRNLEVRWGNGVVEYNGNNQYITAYAEGVIEGQSVTFNVVYTDDTGKIATPLNAGRYTAHATLSYNVNYQLAENADVSCTFTISPKTVQVVWSTDSFVYTGQDLKPEAYYVNLDGDEVPLTVNVSSTDHSNANTYGAVASGVTDGNYKLGASASTTYTIKKAPVTLTWGTTEVDYTGSTVSPSVTLTGVEGEDLTPDLNYVYLLGAVKLSYVPSDAGEYTVQATLVNGNYYLADKDGKEIAYAETVYTVKPAAMTVTSTYSDDKYTGAGKAPTLTAAKDDGTAITDITITYAAADASYKPTGEYGADMPVNVGKYVAKVVENNGNYVEKTVNFEIKEQEVSVVWSCDELAVIDGTTYKWLYDGKAHAPKYKAVAQVNGSAVELEVEVTGRTITGTQTLTATLKNTEENKNFKLVDNTAKVEIVRLPITKVVWYEYGSTTPIEAGKVPSYQYISVYGRQGPKLSAYGEGTIKGTDDTGATVERTASVALAVEPTTYFPGYWDPSETAYSATASVASQDRNYCTLTATELTQEFYVTGLVLETETADVEWVVFDDNGVPVSATGHTFVYSGSPQSPVAIRIIDRAAYELDPTDTATYERLPIGGEKTHVGTYYAYILPCNYDIEDSDASCKYVITARNITISWTVGTYTYNGLAQKPDITINGAGGVPCDVTVTGFVNAGTHTAVAKVSKDFNITSGATQQFTINKLVLDPETVVWSCDADGEEREVGKHFVWTYKENVVRCPEAALTVEIRTGVEVTVNLAVTGGCSAVGSEYYAYAVLDNSDFDNANYKLGEVKVRFDIVQSTVTGIVWDNEVGGEILFTYDGVTRWTPSAYYLDENGDKVTLTVIGGRVEAGTYTAYIVNDLDTAEDLFHDFTIKARELEITWANTSVTYTGNAQHANVTFEYKGAAVNLVYGKDYTVSEFIYAGKHSAEVKFFNTNYACADGSDTCEFEIKQKQLTVTWYGNDAGTFDWAYDGDEHHPTLSVLGGAVAGVTIEVIGGETDIGNGYKAYAVVSDNNYTVSPAYCVFNIVPAEITVVWTGNADNGGKFEWEYDGKTYFAPTPKYTDADGVEHELEALGGRLDANEDGEFYTATAVLPENCKSAGTTGTQTFKVTPKEITAIDWAGNDANSGKFEWEYDGEVHFPVPTVPGTSITLSVTGGAINANASGEHYTATAVLANSKNYVFGEKLDITKDYTITAKEVNVIWYGETGNENDSFKWEYNGGNSLICPTAKFLNPVTNALVNVPVSGGAITKGAHSATAIDVFNNFDFDEFTKTQGFTIEEKHITVTWSDGDKIDGDGNYVFTYDGKGQMPLASTTEKGVTFAYTLSDEHGASVRAIINVGTYTVSINPTTANYLIDGTNKTVTVKIVPKEVEVVWGETELVYTGSDIAPTAWFLDVNKQAVALTVTGEATEPNVPGTPYTATATAPVNPNYVLKQSTVTEDFTIAKQTSDELFWDWDKCEWAVPEEPVLPEEPVESEPVEP